MKDSGESRTLTAHGTLYKALDRLRTAGLLESWWEDPAIAAEEERPRRRLYQISAAGVTALGEAASQVPAGLQQGAAPA
jgi:DNA-binding PadR family transcriptional regulator